VSTKAGYETRANLIRIGEFAVVAKLIQAAPWFGYGIGFAFPIRQVLTHQTFAQWYVHNSYLFVWLKQGVIGLALFIWILGTAIIFCVREARRRENVWESTWFATTAGATVFLSVLSLSNFPFGAVNEMFYLALLWGGAMAMARKGRATFGWSPAATEGGVTSREADRGRGAPAGSAGS
jgi:O-antigen ligase